jgi:6-phosphogluconolactonase
MAELREFPDRETMTREAAVFVAGQLREAIAEHGKAALSLSGGSTPGPVYRMLSDADLDWDRVTLTLSDDRWVDPASEHSNERLVRETLLRGRAAAARFVGLYVGGKAGDALAQIDRNLHAAPRPIDVGILGIGDDGHTASLFPGTEAGPLAATAQGRVAAVDKEGPGESKARITFTLPELTSHRALIFLAQGEDKRAIIHTVLGMSGDPEGLPVARVIAAARGDVSIYWAP